MRATSRETPVMLTVGSTKIPATLNDTRTAQGFLQKLPFTISLQRYEVDYCAPTAPLDTDQKETQHGWSNGDIGLFGGWFTLLFDGEESSVNTPGVMVIGHIDQPHLDQVKQLGDAITLTVERV